MDVNSAENGLYQQALANDVIEIPSNRLEMFLRLIASGFLISDSGVITLTQAPVFPISALTGIVPVANGGTGLASGTSGGVLAYTAAGTLASSAALAANQIVLGGGDGVVPATLGSLGTTTTVLHGNASGAPTYAAVALDADVSGDLPFANLAQGTALSVLGVTGNSTADVASIVAANDAEVLRRSGTAVAFGTVATAGLADAAVTYAKIQNVTDARLLGRSSGSSGPPIEITVGSGLSLSAGALTATGSGAMTLIGAFSGTDANAAAANVATVAISGLTAKDRLLVLLNVASITQQTTIPLLYNSTDSVAVLATMSDGDSTSVAAGRSKISTITIGQMQSAATSVYAHGFTSGNSGASDGVFNQTLSTFTTNYTGSWSLVLRHGGVTSGGTFQFSGAVFKLAGQ